jgi:hypothetical protein
MPSIYSSQWKEIKSALSLQLFNFALEHDIGKVQVNQESGRARNQ